MKEIDKELIYTDMAFKDKNGLFEFIADELKKKGCVTETYEEAIKTREENFPTGFKLMGINIAMPHADPQHSKADKLVVLTLREPVEFQNAEDKEKLDVNMVFCMVFQNRDKHIDYLMKLSNLIQDREKLLKIKNSGTSEEIYGILNKIFG